MKLLMENWRSYASNDSFDLLVEKYNKNLISEEYFLISWEKQFITEGNELFTEGLMDLVQRGLTAGQKLAGDIKDKVIMAVEKVLGWLLQQINNLKSVLGNLRDAGVEGIVKMAGIAQSWASKISKWCGANEILCTISKVVIMIGLGMFMSEVAHAAVQLPSGELMGDQQYEILRGALDFYGEALDEPGQRMVDYAIIDLDAAMESPGIHRLKNLPEIVSQINDEVMTQIKRLLEMPEGAPAGEELAKALRQMAEAGADVSARGAELTQRLADRGFTSGIKQ